MKECFLPRLVGICNNGLPRVDEAALPSATADAGVTVMATDVLMIGLGTLTIGALGVVVISTIDAKPLGTSSEGEGDSDGRFIFDDGQYREEILGREIRVTHGEPQAVGRPQAVVVRRLP
jgi:hypothetical protein